MLFFHIYFMITTINEFKKYLAENSHMKFGPETIADNAIDGIKDAIEDGVDFDGHVDSLEDGLKSALESAEILNDFVVNHTDIFKVCDALKQVYLKYSPYPEMVDEQLEELQKNGLTYLTLEWFTDIDSDDLREHPKYEEYQEKIDDLVNNINLYM